MIASFITNSASLIVRHSHPSNDTIPSPEDLEVTERYLVILLLN